MLGFPSDQSIFIKVSFKQNGQTGFLTDDGSPFGSREDGFEYGWLCDDEGIDFSSGLRTWGNHFDRLTDCIGTPSWQIVAPNGNYDIKVMAWYIMGLQ